jgi:hypothetical protein
MVRRPRGNEVHVKRSSEIRAMAWVAAALLGAGCKHAEIKDANGDAAVATNTGAIVLMPNGEFRKSFDLNGDGKPDAYEYYSQAKDEKGNPALDKDHKPLIGRLLRKEFDLNLDGKIDFWRWYDEKENVTKEALDVDFDGKVDRINYFEKGQRVREESEFDADGKPHTWIHFEKEQIATKERDLHGTGKPDYFEYWENGVIDRIGIDRKGTGTVDYWERNPETADRK